MLVELGLVEQRCQAVLEVLVDGAPVTDVACRYPIRLTEARQLGDSIVALLLYSLE